MSEGEFKKRLKKAEIRIGSYYTDNGIRLKDGLEILDDARKEFPLNPIVEVIGLYNNLRNHSEEEKRIVIKEHLKNCNLERFTLETIEWFLKWFGENKDST